MFVCLSLNLYVNLFELKDSGLQEIQPLTITFSWHEILQHLMLLTSHI